MCQTLESLVKMSIHMCSWSVSKMFASVKVETGSSWGRYEESSFRIYFFGGAFVNLNLLFTYIF